MSERKVLNLFFLIRFDDQPRREVSEVIMKHIAGETEMLTTAGCIITIFASESELQEILLDLGSMKNIDRLFFFLFQCMPGENICMRLPQPIHDGIQEHFKLNVDTSLVDENEYTMDDLLDLISKRGGIKHLKPHEKEIFEKKTK